MNNNNNNQSSSPPTTPKSKPNSESESETPSLNYYHPSPSRPIYSDRFIPSRSASNFALFGLSPPPDGPHSSSSSANYTALLRNALFGSDLGFIPPNTPEKNNFPVTTTATTPTPVSRNIFRFKSQTRQSLHSLSPFGVDDNLPVVTHRPAKAPRIVPRSPYKVLDAPALQDDFYLNLVDWSSHNVLAVDWAIVYIYSMPLAVTQLCDLGVDDTVCSVGWAHQGTSLAIGTSDGKVQIWDVLRCKRVRSMEGHRSRVGALAWSSSMLSSGSRDKSVLQRDPRAQQDFVSKLNGHKSEVCGLKWSHDNRELASGGNDNRLFVWNQHSTQPVLKYCEHTAAVKAIAWSPHLYGLLASGGGTADRCIRFWNTTTNSHLNCVDTGSQVCNLVWSKNGNELVSTHGYSQNQIIVWRYPSMSKLATLTGHTYRVLYLAISPDGQTIVTGAGDETLRFWNAFPSPKSQGEQHWSIIVWKNTYTLISFDGREVIVVVGYVL
ncbi:hypothetical protein OSB04_009992 [Centaurea solstitialis]|uniref:CDC20/Fizzy WD40 domain-containing protein n=1 Tax=Centaurea solstitialis TaxID=347529 RepID=A0AA38TE84_9ASTR|nr:hypothetical protein OSB04_009992 [Centaurea solstitialis]